MTGFNENAAFYKRYHVQWGKIECTFVNPNAIPVIVGITFRPVTNESGWSTWDAWKLGPGNGFPAKQCIMTAAGGSKDKCKLSVQCPLWKLHGNKTEYNDSSYGAITSANPGNIVEGFVYILMPTNTAAGSDLKLNTQIKVTQIIKFMQKKLLFSTLTEKDNPIDSNVTNNGTEDAAEG